MKKWVEMGNFSGWRHTRFTIVSIGLQLALSQLEVLLGDDLVERVSAASELLAGVTVAVLVS